jgi:hypothetical protein
VNTVKLGALGVAVIFLVVLGLRGCTDQGALRREMQALQAQNDSLRRQERGLDTVYVARRDTLRLTRHVTDSILQIDTLIRTDTVRQIIARERAACDAVLNTCEAQKANLRAQILNVQGQLDVEKKRHPSRFGCAGPVVASNKGVGLGAGCGLTIRF